MDQIGTGGTGLPVLDMGGQATANIGEDGPKLLPNILVTGTPGVGKTSLCTLMEDQLKEEYGIEGYQYIKLAELVKEKKLYKEWNQ